MEDTFLPQTVEAAGDRQNLGYVNAVVLPILALNGLHLVFQAEFQLLQPDFFQLFIFAEVTFLGE